MILEGLVTTIDSDGQPHLAPMGPQIEGIDRWHFVLRPFPTSQTYQNLLIHPEGVFHVTDDSLLMARSAIGKVGGKCPLSKRAEHVEGYVLLDCHRYYEFRITNIEQTEPRIQMMATVVFQGQGTRPWFGFNRARHAVLEAAILATRAHLLPIEQLEAEFKMLHLIVDKTGSDDEKQAMELLVQHTRAAHGRSGIELP